MRTSIFIPFVIAFGFISGCRKTEILPPPETPMPCYSKLELIPIADTCIAPLLTDPWGIEKSYPGQNDFYQFAAFDPAAYEKFIFYHGVLYGRTIIKGADFCTGEIWAIEDSVQFSQSLFRRPKWSEKEWVLLVRWIDDESSFPEERGLYKIKPNGDSLTLLLNETVLWPSWKNGDSILTTISGNSQRTFVLDENGAMLDTIPFTFSYSSANGSKIAARRILPVPGEGDIIVYQDGEIPWSYPYTEEFQNFRGLDWLNENEIVWINDSGIYRANTVTNQVALVKEVCPNIYYSSISAARDGSNRLLLTRRDYLFENGITDSMSVRYNISLYDLDTGEEFYVKLGEM
jgi:hypothetical protein